MNKNDIVTLKIESLTAEGNGVGKADGMAVFVPLTAVGDECECKIVKLAKTYAFGRLERVITPAPSRVEPNCEHFAKCGGCVFRHISYQAELQAKASYVKDCINRLGGINLEPMPILGCENTENYRNKAQLPVAQGENGMFFGFFSPRSHRVVPFKACKIQPDVFTEIAQAVTDFCNQNAIVAYNEVTGKGLLRHICLRQGAKSGEIMLVLVVTKKTDAFSGLPEALMKEFTNLKTVVLNINSKNTNVIMGAENVTLCGGGQIFDEMCQNKVAISPHSFYQVNTPAAEKAYAVAGYFAGFTGNETLLDLYCGIGTVGLAFAKNAKRLVGVEVVPQAIENAKANAKLNGITNAEFYCADAGEMAEKLAKNGEKPDVIIVDPPRKGCDSKTLNAIAQMAPQRLVYISCNPATLARDAKELANLGYALEKYQPVDMFPRTSHCETVAKFVAEK